MDAAGTGAHAAAFATQVSPASQSRWVRDETGAEVVEFVDGDVGIYPMPAWVWSDELLVEVAGSPGQIHDASVGLDLPLDGWRREAVEPVEVICHATSRRTTRSVATVTWWR